MKLFKKIRTIINVILFFLTWGVIGGMEQGTIPLGQGIYSFLLIGFLTILINIRRF